MKKTLVIGDCHMPFVNVDSLNKIFSAIKRERPDRIVQIGDLFDMFAYSKFPRSHEGLTPAEEISQARQMAEEMWRTIKKVAPKAMCYLLLGNHDVRPERKALQAAAEFEWIVQKTMKELFTFKGVKTNHDPREELILDNVMYLHGHYTKIGRHLRYIDGAYNVVHGHTHRPGLYHEIFRGDLKWEMDVGFIGDPESKVFHYTQQKWNTWNQAYGMVTEYGPRLEIL